MNDLIAKYMHIDELDIEDLRSGQPPLNPELLTKMTHQSVRGAAVVLDFDKNLKGVITDGDIRRFLEKNQNPFTATAQDLMSTKPKTIDASELIEKALFMMETHRVQMLIVLDQSSKTPQQPVGMIIYQDLLSIKLR